MKKIVLSGGPGTGKSTTLKALKETYPSAHFVGEAAEAVIRAELVKQQRDPTYEPILPTTRYGKFVGLVIVQQVSAEGAIPKDKALAFLDRSIIDNLGYLAHNGLTEHVDRVNDLSKRAGYTIAFFCDWLGEGAFEQNTIRRETKGEALQIHGYLEEAYHSLGESLGIPVVHLPPIDVPKRIEIIRDYIGPDVRP